MPATTNNAWLRRFSTVALLGLGLLAGAPRADAESPEETQAAELLCNVAERRLGEGRFDKALALAERAQAIAATARVLTLVGLSQQALGRCDEALAALEAAGRAVGAGPAPAGLERAYLETVALCRRVEVRRGSTNGMIKLPTATFTMGSNDGEDDEQPPHSVTVSTFWLDRLEVTAGQYQACVDAGGCPRAHFRVSGDMPYCNYGEPGRRDHAMNCVDFHGAEAYCRFAGKRLPTEAEWERAARGAAGRTYPWGEEAPDCTRVVMENDENDGCGEDHVFPGASRPKGATPEGIQDLAGNVWEWVSDYYDPHYYAASPERNPAGPASGQRRGMRGSSWLASNPKTFRGANRDSDALDYVGNGVGFRCAMDAQDDGARDGSFWGPWKGGAPAGAGKKP